MPDTKHTPEPWHTNEAWREPHRGYVEVRDADLNVIAYREFHPSHSDTFVERTRNDFARIVDCINACEGINPETVPDLLDACKRIAESLKGEHRDVIWADVLAARQIAEAAIAKATEQES